MEIKIKTEGSVVIAEVSGRIDANSAVLVEAVGQCIRNGYNDILLDLKEVEFIDYLGISAIVLTCREVMNNEGRIKISGIPLHLKELFSVTGIDRAIDIYATQDLAMNGFKEDKAIEDIKKMQLRRRFKRLYIDIKSELRPKSAKNGRCFTGDILNLSAVGAFIYGCGQFKLGDELILKLKLPPKFGEIELDAKVVWLSDKQVQIHVHPGMGIEFYNIPGPAQEKLLEFIEKNLSFNPADQ